MKNTAVFLILFSLLVACSPRTVPANEPIFYKASSDELFAAVVQAISTSPGLDNSTGWMITQSDAAGGFVRAETTVTQRGLFGSSRKDEAISVVISSGGEARTQVVIQESAGAQSLAGRVRSELDLKFNRA